ncbi:MAG: M48 family metalloprotease [Ignavibacteria bacterium]|nr:M48 family metalloprotease [Ignavibacteria bacterium]
MNNFKGRIIIGIIIAIIGVITYFSKTETNPITGEKQRVSLSVDQEIQLGLQAAPELIQEMGGEARDSKLNAYIDKVGNRVLSSTEAGKSPFQFEFYLLADNKTVNAFALPGGQVFITMGLYKLLTTEDQLAGVLGHEIGHVINRHGSEHMAKQQLTQQLVQATQVASGGYDQGMIAQYVGQMMNLKYGRDDEIESDKYGVKYLVESGYKPEAMIEVMEILNDASGKNKSPEFLSSHPNPENRIQKIKEYIQQYKK